MALVAAPSLQDSLPVSFGIFGALTVYSIHFIKNHVPETRGLSLEQITIMLAGRPKKVDVRSTVRDTPEAAHAEDTDFLLPKHSSGLW